MGPYGWWWTPVWKVTRMKSFRRKGCGKDFVPESCLLWGGCTQWGCSWRSQALRTDGAIHGVASLSSEGHVGMETLAPVIT